MFRRKAEIVQGVEIKYRFRLPVRFANDVYSGNSWPIMIIWDVRFLQQSFVDNAAQICAQQTIENTAKNFNPDSGDPRPIYGLHHNLSLKLNKSLGQFITGLCLSNITYNIFKSSFH